MIKDYGRIFRLDIKLTDEEKSLIRCILAVSDITVLYKLREVSRRKKSFK
jgi:hypothetical protein